MTSDPFRIPSDEEIKNAEERLKFKFPNEYIAFLKGGGNVANAIFDAAVILPGSGYLDIFEIADIAWNKMGLNKKWLPFIEDNGDYFCVSENGVVKFWSHNGYTDEEWTTFSAWFQQVCIERK